MRGMTARLGKGFFDPVASPTKESLRALLWNLQSRGLPSPCTLDRGNTISRMRKCFCPSQRRFHSPLEPMTADCSGHNQRAPRCGYLALWKPDRGLRTPAPRQAFRACNRPRRCLGTLHYRRAGGNRK